MAKRIASRRIWEIDVLRGLAILMMATFHLIVDLRDFYHIPIEYLSGFWFYFGRSSAALFIVIAGISSTLNPKVAKHGVVVLIAGAVVSLVTYSFDPVMYVRFGILQFMGCSLLTYPLVRNLPNMMLLAMSAASIAAGPVVQSLNGHWLLLPLGVMPAGFRSMDYYPLIPWYGVYLIGVLIGQIFYRNKTGKLSPIVWLNWVTWLGRHSLVIYLTHQPVLLAVLYIIFTWLI